METAELINALSQQAGAGPAARIWRRIAVSILAGAALALILMLLLEWSPLPHVGKQPWFWMKVGYASALLLPSVLLLARLSRPGALWRRPALAASVPVVLMLILSLVQVLPLAPEERLAAWRGATWTVCSLRIGLLSIPIIFCLFAAVRSLAPTDPARAGMAVGLCSGTVAAAIYALHCPESSIAFVAVWYNLGIMAAVAFGTIGGRFLLHW